MSTTSKKRTRPNQDEKEEEEEKKRIRQKHERSGRLGRRHAKRQEQEAESQRQHARGVIHRLMQTGSVLDPLAQQLVEAKEQDDISSIGSRLLWTVDKDEDMQKLHLVDPLDSLVALGEAYEWHVQPVASEWTAALMTVPEITRWPPGLASIVVGMVAGERSEREWEQVRSEWAAESTDDKTAEDWRQICGRIWRIDESSCQAWRMREGQGLFHPLSLIGIWSCVYGQYDRRLSEWVTSKVRRHSGLVKALAILRWLVVKTTGTSVSCEWIHHLLIHQSERVHDLTPAAIDSILDNLVQIRA